MTKHGCILLQTDEGWRLAAATAETSAWQMVHGGVAVEPQKLAAEVAEFIAAGELSRQVALALDSTATLAASFTVSNPADLRDRRLLGYKIEEFLPVAAEDLVADYVSDGQHVLGVAATVSSLLPVVVALEEHGLRVQSISPAAILALQSFVELSEKRECDLIAWQNGPAVELFRVGRRVLNWRHLPSQPSALIQQVGASLLRSGGRLRILLIDVDRKLQVPLEQLDQIESQIAHSASMAEHARRGATAALIGKGKPWIELRRDELMAGDPHRAVRGAWRLCLASLAALLISLTTFFWLRSFQYDRLVESVQQQQKQLFREVFPKSRVPGAVVSRLKSEHAKLIGAHGREAAVRLPPSALNVLYALVTGMPSTVRLQVQQLRIEDGRIDLDVNVRSVGKAGALAEALQNHGFAIAPPTTEQGDSKSVAVRIHGVFQGDDMEERLSER